MSSVAKPPVSPLGVIVREFRSVVLGVAVFSLFANLLLLTPTLYMLQIYDRVMLSRSGLTLIAVSLIALCGFGVIAFSEWARSRILVRAGVRFDERLNSEVFKANFEAALNRGQHKPAEAFNDLTNLRQFITGNGVFAFFDAPWTPIYIAVSWMLHPTLGLLSIVFALILLLTALFGHLLTRDSHAKAQTASRNVSNFVQSKLRNADAVHAMGMLDGLKSRWRELHQRQLDVAGRIQDHSQRFQSLTKFLQYTQQAMVLAAGALLVIRGELTPGAMIAANVLMARALQPMQMMVGIWKSFMAARLSYQRLAALLRAHPPRSGLHVPETLRPEIIIEHLVATVEGRERPILDGVSATIRPGEVIAILGPSGSGKSTLLRCILGIWPQTQGTVRLDGEPVCDWDRSELGRHLGYLPQDIELLEGSVAENIARFGVVDTKKVIAAAQAAGVHAMILRFPQGYDMPMGQVGGTLSGGQRQRIGLARALYDEPALILLDEPDANLDDAGGAALVKAIRMLKEKGRTVIVVTHRGPLVKLADRVIHMNQGRIQAFGPVNKVFGRIAQPGPATEVLLENHP